MDVARVLVVDDAAAFRAAAHRLVAAAGLRCIGHAESGPEAVSMAVALRPDLVLMDVHLPGCSGLEAARRTRRLLPRAVVVLCSTYRQEDVTFVSGDVQAYVRKEDLTPAVLSELWLSLDPDGRPVP